MDVGEGGRRRGEGQGGGTGLDGEVVRDGLGCEGRGGGRGCARNRQGTVP